MNVLGIRCSNTDYAYVILTGNRAAPQIIEKNLIAFPKGYSRSESLKWFYQEIDGVLIRVNINAITIKGAEALAARGQSFVSRVENEAMIFLSASNHGLENISRKVKVTIAKDLGLKGKAKNLAQLDTSILPNFLGETDKVKEAILAAWSSLE